MISSFVGADDQYSIPAQQVYTINAMYFWSVYG